MSISDVWQRRAAKLHDDRHGTAGLQLYEVMEKLDLCYARAKTVEAAARISTLADAYTTYLFFLWGPL